MYSRVFYTWILSMIHGYVPFTSTRCKRGTKRDRMVLLTEKYNRLVLCLRLASAITISKSVSCISYSQDSFQGTSSVSLTSSYHQQYAFYCKRCSCTVDDIIIVCADESSIINIKADIMTHYKCKIWESWTGTLE